MARMRPELTEEQLQHFGSQAEAKVYRALRDRLPDDALVIHSLAWIYRNRDGTLIEGEADFTLFFREAGYLTVEVKGGGIAYDAQSGVWSSIDRKGIRHRIKDPFHQARQERFAILDQLRGHPEWRKWPGRRIQTGHSVFFPDLEDSTPLHGPDRPKDIIGVSADLKDIPKWISRALTFWKAGGECQPLGSIGVTLAEAIFCKSIEVRAPLAAALDAEEQIRIRLTEQQARILRILGGRKRAVISGGAGTGKTLIAAEKSRLLALEGQDVLFLCYNRPLADALRLSLRDISSLQVMTFHQLADIRIEQVRRETGRDLMKEADVAYPGSSEQHRFNVQVPFALALSNEVLNKKVDAIVVDEAQDFSDEYWFAIEELLADPKEGHLYLFTDPNQAVYKRHSHFPVQDAPFHLTTNCRNTSYIHAAAYRYFKGETTDPPEIRGEPLASLTASGIDDQAAAIVGETGRLLAAERVQAGDIVILVCGRPKKQYYEALLRYRLPRGVNWDIEVASRDAALIDTVARFKGLEAPVIFLWLPPVLDDVDDRETLYVGLSRAKSRVYVVGTQRSCSSVMEA